MRSLWLKLLSAFIGVILLSAGLNHWLVSRATSGQFSRFVVASGQAWVQQTALLLADHYARTGSWQGANSLLRAPWSGSMMGMSTAPAASTPPAQPQSGWMDSGMMGHGMESADDWMGPGMGEGLEHGPQDGEEASPAGPSDHGGWDEHMMDWDMMDGNVWRGLGLRLLLANAQGQVVADTDLDLVGTRLAPAELAAGVPITVANQAVGTLLAVSALTAAPSPAAAFLTEVNRATWLASAMVSALAVLLGLLLVRQIVAPVRAVTAAAQRVAAGDLEQRVPVTTQDEIGQLARSFNQMADALALDRQLRRHMIADIAHELRTPLSVIQGNLEAMLDGVLPAEPQEIASLHEETVLLARLIGDLRLLSLAEAGQIKLERTPTDLGALAGRLVDHLHVQAAANQVTLTADMPPELPLVPADPDRLGQVLSNLLTNALRYTPPGGRITVRARGHRDAGQAPTVVLQVTDTGSGIDPADLPYVFDRFYRADPSRTRTGGGSGIGLALVKHLVEAHGGRVWVESQVGQGATFSLALPLA